MSELLFNPAFPRALVIGAFGGAGLSLTALYSRRGPMIYPVYAAILAALAALLSRFPEQSYGARLVACLVGFMMASAALYVTVGIHARRRRLALIARGRLPASAANFRVSLGGHAWRIGFLLTIGTVASAGVAFIAA
ncbi:MAG: hypothetical protein ACREPM_07925 [Gemmatimonadaceae bacterium]